MEKFETGVKVRWWVRYNYAELILIILNTFFLLLVCVFARVCVYFPFFFLSSVFYKFFYTCEFELGEIVTFLPFLWSRKIFLFFVFDDLNFTRIYRETTRELDKFDIILVKARQVMGYFFFSLFSFFSLFFYPFPFLHRDIAEELKWHVRFEVGIILYLYMYISSPDAISPKSS